MKMMSRYTSLVAVAAVRWTDSLVTRHRSRRTQRARNPTQSQVALRRIRRRGSGTRSLVSFKSL